MVRDRCKPSFAMPAPRYVVEGEIFSTFSGVFTAAQRKGFTGSRELLKVRFDRSATWASLLATLDPDRVKLGHTGAGTLAARRKAEKDEIAAMCAELDKRRAEIKARTGEEE